MEETRSINITAEPQLDPRRCLFRTDQSFHPGTLFTSDPAWAEKWAPLAKAVFDVGGIRDLRIHNGEILVTREEMDGDWRDLARRIGSAIRAHFQSGSPAVHPDAASKLEGPDLLRQQVQEVIDEQLNPALAAHGGFVEIQDLKGNDLYINLGGGCQGCGAAAATLRQGVEVAIREAVPEVGAIYDATDHAAGLNPYI